MRRLVYTSSVVYVLRDKAAPQRFVSCTSVALQYNQGQRTIGFGGPRRGGDGGGAHGRHCEPSRPRQPRGYGNGGVSVHRHGHPKNSNREDGTARRTPEQFLEQDVQRLVELRQELRQASTQKDRHEITREARRSIGGIRLDPSTQDERSVALFLNCAVAFKVRPSATNSIDAAVAWMRRNLRGLSPRSVALFTNALGALEIPEADVILRDQISDVVPLLLSDMTPVEVVMILQAFQRERLVTENEALQNEMLKQLAPCISTMPTQQLSTLASVLAYHPLKKYDLERWQAMVTDIVQRTTVDLPIDRMHSKEVITFLSVAHQLSIPEDTLITLIERAIDTCGFHTADQVADLLKSLAFIRSTVTDPSDALSNTCSRLQSALIARLERVAEFASLGSAHRLWRAADRGGLELPVTIQEKLADAVHRDLVYRRNNHGSVTHCAVSLASQKLPSTALLVALADYAVGQRPSRPGHEATRDITEEEILSRQSARYSRHLSDYVHARISLERAFDNHGATLPQSLSTVLPQALLDNVGAATPREALCAVRLLLILPDSPSRNSANDAALLAAITQTLQANRGEFLSHVSEKFLEFLRSQLSESPRGKEFLDLLQQAATKA